MRIPLIAANWKMHLTAGKVQSLLQEILTALNSPQMDVVICPPAPYLALAHQLLKQSSIHLGAQNVYPAVEGAYTGEISPAMLKDVGCEYVIVGHSERRTLFHEDVFFIAEKVAASLKAELTPILCVGERFLIKPSMILRNYFCNIGNIWKLNSEETLLTRTFKVN